MLANTPHKLRIAARSHNPDGQRQVVHASHKPTAETAKLHAVVRLRVAQSETPLP